MFVDHVRVYAKAGDGGHGCASFRRGKFAPKGGPDGGDGGKGGDIVLEVSNNVNSLRDFYFKPLLKADHGRPGQGQQKTGKGGKTLVVKVPPGTVIYREVSAPGPEADAETEAGAEADGRRASEIPGGGEEEEGPERAPALLPIDDARGPMSYDLSKLPEDSEDDSEDDSDDFENGEHHHEAGAPGEVVKEVVKEVVADLTEVGERFKLCEGGAPGKGNLNFASATNRAPREFTPGGKGDQGYYFLELRQIANAGLVGFPNAGKSTLLGKLSAAKPKVAAYPFTTLQPKVGVVDLDGFARATVADIPGLIEGAHANVGLGHDFLRHITRCRILLFVVDMAGSEGRDPGEDIAILRKEIKLYDEQLAKQPWLVLANKKDLPEFEENLAMFKTRFPRLEVIPISAEHEEGLDLVKRRLLELVEQEDGDQSQP